MIHLGWLEHSQLVEELEQQLRDTFRKLHQWRQQYHQSIEESQA